MWRWYLQSVFHPTCDSLSCSSKILSHSLLLQICTLLLLFHLFLCLKVIFILLFVHLFEPYPGIWMVSTEIFNLFHYFILLLISFYHKLFILSISNWLHSPRELIKSSRFGIFNEHIIFLQVQMQLSKSLQNN